jgi:uncharacterized surface protein with fasciclin (FAS1) repeats
MKNSFKLASIAFFGLLLSFNAKAQEQPKPVEPKPVPVETPAPAPAPKMGVAEPKTVVEVATGSSSHTTLVAALKAADLVTALEGTGPFTVFAPVNDAFAKLPAGTVDELLKPENKEKLSAVLMYHVIEGNVAIKDILTAIRKGKGTATYKTLNQKVLTCTFTEGKIRVADENGGASTVTISEIKAGNGFVYIVDSVLLPK